MTRECYLLRKKICLIYGDVEEMEKGMARVFYFLNPTFCLFFCFLLYHVQDFGPGTDLQVYDHLSYNTGWQCSPNTWCCPFPFCMKHVNPLSSASCFIMTQYWLLCGYLSIPLANLHHNFPTMNSMPCVLCSRSILCQSNYL